MQPTEAPPSYSVSQQNSLLDNLWVGVLGTSNKVITVADEALDIFPLNFTAEHNGIPMLFVKVVAFHDGNVLFSQNLS